MHSKGNHKQNEKTTLRMGENICKRRDHKGLIYKNLQTAHTALCQKKTPNNPNQKVGRRSKQTFLQRRHADGQQAHEKMLNIANYQRNTNRNYNEISLHTSQNGHHE